MPDTAKLPEPHGWLYEWDMDEGRASLSLDPWKTDFSKNHPSEFFGDRARNVRPVYTADQVQSTNWQPIETAPRDGTLVDLWLTDGRRETECRWSTSVGGWWRFDENATDVPVDNPTHWMPIPPPPAPDAKKPGPKPR